MSLDFEAVHAALFALAQSQITGIKTYSRTLKAWADVPAGVQPALFQAEKDYQVSQDYGVPAKWTLHADWYVYVSGDAQDQPASTQLNLILNQVVAAIPPANNTTQVQTLGGLVYRCWINGRIETDEGVLGSQRVAIVPIEILVV